VLKQAGDLSRKVLITCSLPMNPNDTVLAIAHTSSGAEALAKKTKRARVVSAFGTVPSEVLSRQDVARVGDQACSTAATTSRRRTWWRS
jgi:predicted dinucleotide-binding enzyme